MTHNILHKPEGRIIDWFKAAPNERPKTLEEFRAEVKQKRGLDLDSIPKGVPEDLLGGASLMAFENLRLVGIDPYPEKDDDGNEIYKEFRLVDLSGAETE